MIVIWQPKDKSAILDITQFVSTITWSGSAGQASRQLEIAVLYSPFDNSMKDLNITLGDRIQLYDENYYLLIDAMIYTRERASEQGTINYQAFDDLNRLCQSNGVYNFKNTTPEKITKLLCSDLKISSGDIAITNVPIPKLIVDGDTYYTIIMKAYTKANKNNGKKYMPLMLGRKLSIIEKGKIVDNLVLSDSKNITQSSYSEAIDGMINTVKIFDDQGKQVGIVKNESDIADYGIFQDVYTMEEGVKASIAAKNMLQGITKGANLEALGNIKCMSGYAIKIKDSITGLTGKFWIESDSHTWQDGVHKMSLDLSYKNIMDIQEDN